MVYIPMTTNYLPEVTAFGLMTLAFIFISLCTRYTKLHMVYVVIGYLILALFAFVKISFYKMYGAAISASALFVIFETNTDEASDYLENYFDFWTLLYLGILLLFLCVLLYRIFKREHNVHYAKLKLLSPRLAYVFAAIGCLLIINKHFRAYNIPRATLSTWDEYTIAKQNLKDRLAKPTSLAFSEVTANDEPQTYIVVIGESTSSWHMQLYGYARETNPKLMEIASELTVMDSVISPHVHTIVALDKILTLSSFENPTPEPNGSIIQLANQAGFTTYWISNQRPVGLHESIPTILGSAAERTHFMATDDYSFTIHDDSILPALEEALQEPASKKVIFVHLIGTHLKYEKRYPPSFNAFEDIPPSLKFQTEKAIAQTNTYDNAVRYNDYIMRQIIEQLRQQTGIAALTYFSDHGDEVFDTMEFVGHNDYHGTRPMYEVPMLFWFSDAYKNKYQDVPNAFTSRTYSLENFAHTFAGMTHIHFNGYEASRNVLDSAYVARKRTIKNGQDYDLVKLK